MTPARQRAFDLLLAAYDARIRKGRARAAVAAAIGDGRLSRPEVCSLCSKPSAFRYGVEAHHANYDRPLDVAWLCRRCHRKEHARMDREGVCA